MKKKGNNNASLGFTWKAYPTKSGDYKPLFEPNISKFLLFLNFNLNHVL